MKKINQYLYLLIILCGLLGCSQLEDFPILEPTSTSPLFLAHRGGQSEYPENTLAAIKVGLSKLDGVEIDLHISKDQTLWIAHDAETPKCGNLPSSNFSDLRDTQIEALNQCLNTKERYNTLDEVLVYVAENYPNAKLSLDVKPKNNAELRSVAIQIHQLSEKYGLSQNIYVESPEVNFLQYLKRQNSLIECHLLAYSNLEKAGEKALRNGLDGVSFKFSAKENLTVKALQIRGLTVQLWTVNEDTDIEKAINLGPNAIQTDRLDFK
jgi:glycerophosphoryl diester phosphodiesterase